MIIIIVEVFRSIWTQVRYCAGSDLSL